MMTLIDTHAHTYLHDFEAGAAGLIDRAKQAGLSHILLPAVDSETHELMFRQEKNFPGFCLPMMGVHPCSVKENFKDELAIAERLLASRPFYGVGEIGLDFYWDKTFTAQQYEAFQTQLDWALQYDLPVSIHSRNATDECLEVVAAKQNGRLKGAFHCFSGTAEQARKAVDLGFYLGIGGVLTFKNSGLDQAILDIDPSHFILETDAPYLAPVPFRGKRNEPAYLVHVVQKLADLKQMPVAEMAAITTANAQKLFGL